jgi:hypothetical protein
MSDVKAYLKYRDEVLLSGDVERVIKLLKESYGAAPTHAAAERAMHQAITAALSLPMEHRIKSKKWLSDRGLDSWDDGDIPTTGDDNGQPG